MAENRSKKEVIWIDLLLHLDLSINKGTYNFYQKLFLSTSLTLFKIIQGNQLVEKQGWFESIQHTLGYMPRPLSKSKVLIFKG